MHHVAHPTCLDQLVELVEFGTQMARQEGANRYQGHPAVLALFWAGPRHGQASPTAWVN